MTSEKTFPSRNWRNNLHSTSHESPLEDTDCNCLRCYTVTRFIISCRTVAYF